MEITELMMTLVFLLVGLPVFMYWLVLGFFALRQDKSDRTSHEASTLQAEFNRYKLRKASAEEEHHRTIVMIYIHIVYEFFALTSFSFLPSIPWRMPEALGTVMSSTRLSIRGLGSLIFFGIIFLFYVISSFLFLRNNPKWTRDIWLNRVKVLFSEKTVYARVSVGTEDSEKLNPTSIRSSPIPNDSNMSMKDSTASDRSNSIDVARKDGEPSRTSLGLMDDIEEEEESQYHGFERFLAIMLNWNSLSDTDNESAFGNETRDQTSEDRQSPVPVEEKKKNIFSKIRQVYYSHGPRVLTQLGFIPVCTATFRTMACRYPLGTGNLPFLDEFPSFSCWNLTNPLHFLFAIIGLCFIFIMYPLALQTVLHINDHDPNLRFVPRFLVLLIMFQFLQAFITNFFVQYPVATIPITMLCLSALATYNWYQQPALGDATTFNHWRTASLSGAAWGAIMAFIVLFLAPNQVWTIIVYASVLPFVIYGGFRASKWRGKKLNEHSLDQLGEVDESLGVEHRKTMAENVANLALTRANREKLMNSGALTSLLFLLTTDDSNVRTHAARAVANLSADSVNREVIFMAGTVPVLVNRLKTVKACDTPFIHHATRVTYHLSCHRDVRSWLAGVPVPEEKRNEAGEFHDSEYSLADLIDSLLATLTNEELSESTLFNVLRTLINLSVESAVKEIFLTDSRMKSLLDLARLKRLDSELRKSGLTVLYNLANSEKNRDLLAEENHITMIYRLSSLSSLPNLALMADKLLARLSLKNPDVKMKISRIARTKGKINPNSSVTSRLFKPTEAAARRLSGLRRGQTVAEFVLKSRREKRSSTPGTPAQKKQEENEVKPENVEEEEELPSMMDVPRNPSIKRMMKFMHTKVRSIDRIFIKKETEDKFMPTVEKGRPRAETADVASLAAPSVRPRKGSFKSAVTVIQTGIAMSKAIKKIPKPIVIPSEEAVQPKEERTLSRSFTVVAKSAGGLMEQEKNAELTPGSGQNKQALTRFSKSTTNVNRGPPEAASGKGRVSPLPPLSAGSKTTKKTIKRNNSLEGSPQRERRSDPIQEYPIRTLRRHVSVTESPKSRRSSTVMSPPEISDYRERGVSDVISPVSLDRDPPVPVSQFSLYSIDELLPGSVGRTPTEDSLRKERRPSAPQAAAANLANGLVNGRRSLDGDKKTIRPAKSMDARASKRGKPGGPNRRVSKGKGVKK